MTKSYPLSALEGIVFSDSNGATLRWKELVGRFKILHDKNKLAYPWRVDLRDSRGRTLKQQVWESQESSSAPQIMSDEDSWDGVLSLAFVQADGTISYQIDVRPKPAFGEWGYIAPGF